MKKYLLFFGTILLPIVAFAAAPFSDFKGFVDFVITSIFRPVSILLVNGAVIYFLWGVVKYVKHGGNKEKREEGVKTMFYGVIAIFVMVSLWGFVNILLNTFGF